MAARSSLTFAALGTTWWIDIFDEIDDETRSAVLGRATCLVEAFERSYSRFKSDSLISILNRERRLHSPSRECRALLEYGQALYMRTDGIFNILVGHILEARGYDANYSFKAQAEIPKSTCDPNSDLKITETEILLACGNIDLGGYGKGYLIDLVAEELKASGVHYFLINGGGDIYGTSDHETPITVYLEHPTEPKKYLIEATIQNQGFAASSPFKRQWNDKERTFTHIVSESAVHLVASFVKAATAGEADAFATAALLLDETKLIALAEWEKFQVARFDPATSRLWRTKDF
ncbi:MAG: FAD:protein FMN transferase [Patescibacteria group bacterium]